MAVNQTSCIKDSWGAPSLPLASTSSSDRNAEVRGQGAGPSPSSTRASPLPPNLLQRLRHQGRYDGPLHATLLLFLLSALLLPVLRVSLFRLGHRCCRPPGTLSLHPHHTLGNRRFPAQSQSPGWLPTVKMADRELCQRTPETEGRNLLLGVGFVRKQECVD